MNLLKSQGERYGEAYLGRKARGAEWGMPRRGNSDSRGMGAESIGNECDRTFGRRLKAHQGYSRPDTSADTPAARRAPAAARDPVPSTSYPASLGQPVWAAPGRPFPASAHPLEGVR